MERERGMELLFEGLSPKESGLPEQLRPEKKGASEAFQEWLAAGIQGSPEPGGPRSRPEQFRVLDELEKKLFGMPYPFPEVKEPMLEILKWLRQGVCKDIKENTNFLMEILRLFEKKIRQQKAAKQNFSPEEIRELDSVI